MGIILFYLHYIVAVILLYHILRCIYVKGSVTKGYVYDHYEKTDSDKKLTHPLWVVILFLIVLCIPILNLMVFILYLASKLISESGDKHNPYYCRSVFTKEY